MQERIPLNKRICNKLKDEISRRKFTSGSLLPGEKKLAELYGVSRKTVRHALNLLEKEKIAIPVNGLGWKICGQPQKGLKPVAVINYYRDFNSDFAHSVYSFLQSNGLKVRFYQPISADSDLEEILTPENYSGLIYLSCNPVPKYHVMTAKKHHLPIACAGLNSEQPYDTISSDNVAAINILINNLIYTGHRNILFVGTKIMDPAFSIRHRTYFNSIKRHSMKPRSIILDESYLTPSGAEMLLHEYSKKTNKVDAVLAVNTRIARGILAVFRENGIRVPKDISLTSVGNPIDPGELSHYGLTTVTGIIHPWKEIGRRTAERILARLKGDTSPAGMELVKPLLATSDSIFNRTGKIKLS